MRNEAVVEFFLGLDEDSPLVQRVRHEHFPKEPTLSTTQRLWYVHRAAGFGSHLTFAYFQAGRELPKHVGWPAVLRAYRCLQSEVETKRTDPACHAALGLGHPSELQTQAVLKGYLCSGLSYEEIAARFGIEIERLKLFAHLFCDFPERRDCGQFVQGVLDPRSELPLGPTDLSNIEDPVLRFMNIGFRLGPEAVDRAAGRPSANPQNPLREAEMLRSLKRSLLSAAQTKADLELQSTADLGLALVKTMVAAEAKSHPDTTDRDWRMGLGALSMDQGAQHVLKGLIQAGAMERLKLEHVYDAEMAAERTKKKAGEGGGSVGAPPAQSAT